MVNKIKPQKKLVISVIFFLFVTFSSILNASDWHRDGHLRLYHSHRGDWLEVHYEQDGQIVGSAIEKINHFMRSRGDDKIYPIDINLIYLLDHVQDYFQADTVEIICGYRSPGFNHSLRAQGRNVAEQSYHMNGIAVDIHLDEIPENRLAQYLRSLKKGGVGYYPKLLMVHVDLGIQRFWQEDQFVNRLDIGEFNRELNVSLKTDRLFYFGGQNQKLLLKNPDNTELSSSVKLEWFYRGHWQEWLNLTAYDLFATENLNGTKESSVRMYYFKSVTKNTHRFILKTSNMFIPHGKFRWKVFTKDGRVQYSNEFYLKKR